MYNINCWWITLLKIRLLVSSLVLFMSISKLNAQDSFLIADGVIHTISSKHERYQDFVVPNRLHGYNQIIIEAEGADGGWVEYTYHDRFDTRRTKRVNGGEGATVTAVYSVAAGNPNITPGAILRFIVGVRGHYAKYDLLSDGYFGAGGGGGTAVLISKDGGANWKLLLVAGGGGGAGLRFLNHKEDVELNAGQPGSSNEHGYGGTHHNIIMADGGLHGEGGRSYKNTGGGGGAFGDGKHTVGQLYYGNAGWKDKKLSEPPMGGLGGMQKGCVNGGSGFGGGGSGKEGGGGGGGYSGGGAGKNGFGGGGGGSYVNHLETYATNVNKIQNDNTNNSGDGYVRYKFSSK